MRLPARVTLKQPRWHEVRRGAWAVSVEWEPRDLWVGVFLKRERHRHLRPAVHVYVCPLPTLVLHLIFAGRRPQHPRARR